MEGHPYYSHLVQAVPANSAAVPEKRADGQPLDVELPNSAGQAEEVRTYFAVPNMSADPVAVADLRAEGALTNSAVPAEEVPTNCADLTEADQ